MTLKEAMEAEWRSRGVRNHSHINRWYDTGDEKTVEYFRLDACPVQRIMAHRGKKVQLKVKRSKYRGATQPWLTDQGLKWYRAQHATFAAEVSKARKVLGLV